MTLNLFVTVRLIIASPPYLPEVTVAVVVTLNSRNPIGGKQAARIEIVESSEHFLLEDTLQPPGPAFSL
jgi:hypothetical protein